MLIVGIDPGYSGAIALLNGSVLQVHDMPTAPAVKGRVEMDLYRLGQLLSPDVDGICPETCVAVLEKVATMPGQGISSAFRFGEGYGAIQMALVGHGWERNYVTPATWKKHFKLSRDKGVSRALASQRFPQYAHLFDRVKDDGRAEAALLALYGREVILPQQNRAAA